MNRIIQTCFSLRDDQIVKRGGAYATLGVTSGVFFLVLAVLIVGRFGLHPEPIRSSIGQISDKLLQHANTTSAESGTVVRTGNTIFLRKIQSLITKIPFVAGLLLFSLGMTCIQCGLMFYTLKAKTGESPTKDSTLSTEGAPSVEK